MTGTDSLVGTERRPGIDGPAMVRAASTGFTVLLLGGLVAPLVAAMVPVVGRFWLVLVAVAAFVIAGSRIGAAAAPAVHGAVAAVSSYLLMLPGVMMTTGLQVGQVLTTASAAVVVGALGGYLTARFGCRADVGRSPMAKPSGGSR